MKKLRFFAILIALIIFSIQAFSQKKRNLSLHVGPSFPTGDFGDDDDEDNGAAAVGFAAGLNYIAPLTDTGLGLYFGADFILNPLSKDAQDEIEDDFEDAISADADFTFYKYINIPISAGLDYTFDANEKVSLFGQAGVTLSLLKLTNLEIETANDEIEGKFDLSTTFGFNVGGGLILNDKVEINLKYYGLGEHEIEGEISNGVNSEDEDFEVDLKVSLLILTLGLRL